VERRLRQRIRHGQWLGHGQWLRLLVERKWQRKLVRQRLWRRLVMPSKGVVDASPERPHTQHMHDDNIHLFLDDIAAVRCDPRCVDCECLLGILVTAERDLSRFGTPVADVGAEAVRAWMAEGRPTIHKCLGCDPCLPVEPSRRLTASSSGSGCGPSCGC
jgi:hypothetical protein